MYIVKATKMPHSKMTVKMVDNMPMIRKFKSLGKARAFMYDKLDSFRLIMIENKKGFSVGYKVNYNHRLVKSDSHRLIN